jgi:hypothetical protein
MTLDSMRAGPARRRTSPRSSELLWRRLKIENTATRRQSQAARREALQSAVKLIRRRFGADTACIGANIIAEGAFLHEQREREIETHANGARQ